eukprot:NODE_10343_length_289_cov_188.312500_g8575_i0.p3 GENE.NODE_10343_length_289_cov_188.312500_g8575_i0~~NODE_10343_length_289_cov_188.312500_g8575_i0.p3  ORF type:complete len:58 (+),score=23.57 NODE_10343_length_289_cov_188.312500_g8575_i0:27-176(+)
MGELLELYQTTKPDDEVAVKLIARIQAEKENPTFTGPDGNNKLQHFIPF